MKHNIYVFSLFLKILYFLSKESLNIPEYRCLLIGLVHYLYTIEHAVENIASQSISVTLLSLQVLQATMLQLLIPTKIA